MEVVRLVRVSLVGVVIESETSLARVERSTNWLMVNGESAGV
jgi:hypothetical protein